MGAAATLCAGAEAWWSSRAAPSTAPPARLASTFVVAAALGLPAPAAIVVALAALGVSGGTGLAGRTDHRAKAFVAGALAAVVAQLVATRTAPLAGLLAAAAVYTALAGTAWVIEWILRAPAAARDPGTLAMESVNVLSGAIVAWTLHAGDPALFGAACALVLLAGQALAARARALGGLRATGDALASRVSELATLHAIGREILSTLEPEKIFSIVERECRKILDVDFLFIGVLDRETNEIRISYRALAEPAPHETHRPLGDGLASWIVREKRSLRIDDAVTDAAALPFHPHMVDSAVRSVIAAPLLVEGRVIGVLSAQSRRPRAYDDHRLSVLATIAQQTAVAVENARHYALATVDSLTGLYLRDYFFRRLEEEHLRAKRYTGAFSILMLDLDGFKDINDREGHLAGDRYLRALGGIVKARLRGADLACRYGGDEFCILLPETDMAGARPIAERIRGGIAALAVDVEGVALRTTVSIGIASYPEHDGADLKALLLRADQALYQAKRTGRDRVVPYAA